MESPISATRTVPGGFSNVRCGTGDLVFTTGATVGQLTVTGNERMRINTSGAVLPGVTDTQRFGTLSARWLSVSAATYTGVVHGTLDPTVADIPNVGDYQVWYNQTSDEARLWMNINGTVLRSVLLT